MCVKCLSSVQKSANKFRRPHYWFLLLISDKIVVISCECDFVIFLLISLNSVKSDGTLSSLGFANETYFCADSPSFIALAAREPLPVHSFISASYP